MRLPDEEELILHYYGESERSDEIERLLETSDELRRQYAAIRQVLDLVEPEPVPARSDLYGHEVWRRVRPQLERSLAAERSRWLSLPKVAGWAIAATLLVAVSFWAGRETAPVEEPTALAADARDRILWVAVADHLEKSQFLLLELANTGSATVTDDELSAARDLTRQNRLYRLAARNSGESDVEYLLEELERFLTELSHLSPGTPEDVEGLVGRLEQKNLIFKIRILGSQLEERTRSTDSGPTT